MARNVHAGKPGPNSVAKSPSGNPANNSGGNPGKSMPQRPIPGSGKSGPPASMRKALAKKNVPTGRDSPGLVR